MRTHSKISDDQFDDTMDREEGFFMDCEKFDDDYPGLRRAIQNEDYNRAAEIMEEEQALHRFFRKASVISAICISIVITKFQEFAAWGTFWSGLLGVLELFAMCGVIAVVVLFLIALLYRIKINDYPLYIWVERLPTVHKILFWAAFSLIFLLLVYVIVYINVNPINL